MSYRFYCRYAGLGMHPPELPKGCTVHIWMPARDGMPSGRVPIWPNIVWWLFEKLRIFRNRHSGVLMICRDGRIAHRLLVTAGYFRFPEMRLPDLQIGDTWTNPRDRGLGLATLAMALVLQHWEGRFERLWYIVGEDNAASIRVVEKSGFALVARGYRTKPMQLRFLGQFVISEVKAKDAG